jgi:hypothetical protein
MIHKVTFEILTESCVSAKRRALTLREKLYRVLCTFPWPSTAKGITTGQAKSPGFNVNVEQPVRIKRERNIGMKVAFILPPRL